MVAFIAASRGLGTLDGQVLVFFVMTVAAAEAAVGLAIVIALFRQRETLNPDAFDFAVPEKAEVRERTFPTLPAAVEAARDLQASRPFGTYLKTTVSGPLGTIRVSPNGRLWGDETPNVEYELRGESLAVLRAGRGAVPPAAGGTR